MFGVATKRFSGIVLKRCCGKRFRDFESPAASSAEKRINKPKRFDTFKDDAIKVVSDKESYGSLKSSKDKHLQL
jgi:hypothetical protein